MFTKYHKQTLNFLFCLNLKAIIGEEAYMSVEKGSVGSEFIEQCQTKIKSKFFGL